MRAVAIAACLFVATPAAAQSIPDISLTPGEAVTVSFDDGGQRTVTRGRAEWTPMTVYAARELAGQAPLDAPQTEATGIHAPVARETPARGQFRVRFLSIADGSHVLLALDNGLDIPVRYRARMFGRGRSAPTDVCIVIPRFTQFEHWPHAIERLELSEFQRATWHDGAPVTCE